MNTEQLDARLVEAGLALSYDWPVCGCGHKGNHHTDSEPHACDECECGRFRKNGTSHGISGQEGKRKKRALRRRDGNRCFFCTKPFTPGSPATFDHLRPVTVGGDDSIDNLVLAHQECNLARSADKLGRRRRPSDAVPVLTWIVGPPA